MQSAGPLLVTLLRAATPLGHGGLLCTGGQGLSLVAQVALWYQESRMGLRGLCP